MTSRTRGLTLIELLVALSLLGAVMVASLSFTQMAIRVATDAKAPIHWHNGARATLELIHDDLVSGDFPAPPEAKQNLPDDKEPSPPPASDLVVDGFFIEHDGDSDRLLLRTRTRLPSGHGPGLQVIRCYRLDRENREITVQDLGDEDTPLGDPQVLLGSVARFRTIWNSETRTLNLTLVSAIDASKCCRRVVLNPNAPDHDPEDSTPEDSEP